MLETLEEEDLEEVVIILFFFTLILSYLIYSICIHLKRSILLLNRDMVFCFNIDKHRVSPQFSPFLLILLRNLEETLFQSPSYSSAFTHQ